MPIMQQNVCTPFLQPGETATGYVATAVTGKRLVGSTGRTAGPTLNTSVLGGNYNIAPCGAGLKAFGVAQSDGAVGQLIQVITGPGTIVPITTSAVVASGQEVEATAGGLIQPLASGKSVGYCVNGAASGGDAEIKLY